MKKLKIIFCIGCLSLILFAGRENGPKKPTKINVPTTQASTQTRPTMTTRPTTKTPPIVEQYPIEVASIHDKFNQYIDTDTFEVAKINKRDNGSFSESSIYYSFNISNGTASGNVQFHEFEENIDQSFEINFFTAEKPIKSLIRSVVYICNPTLSADELDKITKTIVASFNGKDIGPVHSVGDYKLYFKEEMYISSNIVLYVIHNDDINSKIDTTPYERYDDDDMNAPLNQGELASIEGKVTDILDLGLITALEVENNGMEYFIPYDYTHFPGFFNIGERYTFYGTITAPDDEYDGGLRLDYCEKIK